MRSSLYCKQYVYIVSCVASALSKFWKALRYIPKAEIEGNTFSDVYIFNIILGHIKKVYILVYSFDGALISWKNIFIRNSIASELVFD